MKFLTAVLLSALITQTSSSQTGTNEKLTVSDSCDIQIEVDKFSGKKTLSTGNWFFDGKYKERVFIAIDNQDGLYKMVILVDMPDVRCFNEKSKLIFLYDDNSKDTIYNEGKLNCKGYLTLYPKNQLQNLSKKKITDIRFFGTEGYFDFTLSKDEGTVFRQNKFHKSISCLLETK